MNLIKKEKYNSNNGWGFGGEIGYYYYYDNDIREFKGKSCYRHMDKSPANWIQVLGPDGYTEILGTKSDTCYLYEIITTGEDEYTYYNASYQKDYFEYKKESNPTSITLIKTISLI